MKLKKANLKRLASLSALGAGALGTTPIAARANSIIYSGPVDIQVGFCPACPKNATFVGPNGAAGEFGVYYFPAGSRTTQKYVYLFAQRGGFEVLKSLSPPVVVSAFPFGAKWGSRRATSNYAGLVAEVGFRSSVPSTALTRFTALDRYLLFRFTANNQDLYGWAQLDVTIATPGILEVALVDWAYDTSGNQIPAGDTGTPEPSTLTLTGLAALVLGAKGLRAWRAARKKAQVAAFSATE